jgi:YebC/PmpR family DNA-binding regulatory protein
MSGHSKWKTIKHQKGVADAKRSQVFTKYGREISVAARQGGPDPESNPRLRLAIDRAREQNMPKDNIERAIKRATGEGGEATIEEVVYEGYGPGGIAILVHALTDNRNRTVSDIRNVFAKAGGNLGEAGSVAWLFETRGVISIDVRRGDANSLDPDEIALRAIDAGADDVQVDTVAVEIYTKPELLDAVRRALSESGVPIASAEISQVPKTTITLGEKQAGQILRLLDSIDSMDDVQRVASNADFPEEVLAAYA